MSKHIFTLTGHLAWITLFATGFQPVSADPSTGITKSTPAAPDSPTAGWSLRRSCPASRRTSARWTGNCMR